MLIQTMTMKAVQLQSYGAADQLKYEDVAMPEPKPDDVLIKVAATIVNPIDWKYPQWSCQG